MPYTMCRYFLAPGGNAAALRNLKRNSVRLNDKCESIFDRYITGTTIRKTFKYLRKRERVRVKGRAREINEIRIKFR